MTKRYAFLALMALFSTWTGATRAQAAPPSTITSIFPVEQKVAAYDPADRSLKFYELKAGALHEEKRFKVPANVWGVTQVPGGYAVATGVGRDDLEAPLRVEWFSSDGSKSRTIFERNGERTQVSFLKPIDSKLWINYFDSKFITKTGYFTEKPDASWDYKELTTLRMGDTVGVQGEVIVIGRPYGEVQGQDGDLRLVKDGRQVELPSYRGVRAVCLFGDAQSPQIAIGDGWHQNYAQFAQGRLSLLKRDAASGRYALQLLDHDASQYGFSRVIDFKLEGQTYLAALGNKSLHVYGPGEPWTKKVVYTRPAEDALYDVVLVRAEGKTATFAVLDHEVRVVTFTAQ